MELAFSTFIKGYGLKAMIVYGGAFKYAVVDGVQVAGPEDIETRFFPRSP